MAVALGAKSWSENAVAWLGLGLGLIHFSALDGSFLH
jgi:hypothetical protein